MSINRLAEFVILVILLIKLLGGPLVPSPLIKCYSAGLITLGYWIPSHTSDLIETEALPRRNTFNLAHGEKTDFLVKETIYRRLV